jgi:hypothetical protein
MQENGLLWNDDVHMKDVFESPQTLPVGLDKAWKYIFDDMSEFLSEYHRIRGDAEVKISPWEKLAHTPEGLPCEGMRKIEAVVQVPEGSRVLPNIPASTVIVENQHAERLPARTRGNSIVIKTSTVSLDVPFGKDFRVQSIISFAEVPLLQCCKVNIQVGINFIKKPFLVSRKVEQQAVGNAKQAYVEWFRLAKEVVGEGSEKFLTAARQKPGRAEVGGETASSEYRATAACCRVTSSIYDSAEDKE